jgi:hypothetical protein
MLSASGEFGIANCADRSIVFVHGLRGDAFKTWSDGDVCWPRDLLKLKAESARIITVCIKLWNNGPRC